MIAVIPAAGIASRLRPLTNNTPKCLLSVGGAPLLQRTLGALVAGGIRQCILVTGFGHERIEQFLSGLALPLDISMVYNGRFASTNNNHSLWLCGPFVRDKEILLLDSDILFDARILQRLLAAPHGDALVIRRSTLLGEEEIKVEVDEKGIIRRIGKHIPASDAAGESVGIARFSVAVTRTLFEILERRHELNEFYEGSFQEMIDGGVHLRAVESGEWPCIEIDTPEDLREAESMAGKLER